jgi:cytochrome P450
VANIEVETKSEPALFNPSSEAFLADRYARFAALRRDHRFYRSELGFCVVSRYKDVQLVLSDARFGKNFGKHLVARFGEAVLEEPAVKMFRNQMLMKNPPDHRRLRKLVSRAFTPASVKMMEPEIEAVADKLVGRFIAGGGGDFIAKFAERLPLSVIFHLLGIRSEGDIDFCLNNMVSRVLDPKPLSREELDELNRKASELMRYLDSVCEERRRAPREDLITALIQAQEGGDFFTHDEFVSTIVMLVGGAYETTVILLANTLMLLARHPEQLARVKRDPSLMGGAVEESLRYESPVQMAARVALQELEIDGHRIARDESVVVLLGSANRDPEVYENPDVYDIGRMPQQILSFGGGIHFCIGAMLSRLEVNSALNKFLARAPEFRVEDVDHPHWLPQFAFRRLRHLDIKFT